MNEQFKNFLLREGFIKESVEIFNKDAIRNVTYEEVVEQASWAVAISATREFGLDRNEVEKLVLTISKAIFDATLRDTDGAAH